MDDLSRGAGLRILRSLPQVQRLLEGDAMRPLLDRYGRQVVVASLRAELDVLRRSLLDGSADAYDPGRFLAAVRHRLSRESVPGLRRVVNATGILLHTNLGRAPLAEEAVAAVTAVAAGYSTLEVDLDTGGRGRRGRAVEPLLRDLTGAEAALVVNNNAACVLLALTALAAGGEVPVSRGELVEIGGSFRVPDIIRQGGARLVEVGTTNRTRLDDYAVAIGPDTRLLLKVHPANYRIQGFTAAVDRADLARLGRAHDVPVVEDLGSGALLEPAFGDGREPTVRAAVAAGVDLVCFSGDKLLGGPQAGIAVGRADLVARMAKHPLMRALRPDKMTLAALEATLRLYRDPDLARRRIPALRMMATPVAVLRARAEAMCASLSHMPGVVAVPVPSDAMAGGGSLPEERLESVAVAVTLDGMDAGTLAARLRDRPLPVIGRVAAGRLILDLRTVAAGEEEEAIMAALTDIAGGRGWGC